MASPLALQVTRSIDDNCEVNNGNANNASLAYIRLDASVPYAACVFSGASEIKGMTIDSAIFELIGHTAGTLNLDARATADKANSPADLSTSVAYDISVRTDTTAYTDISGTLNTSTYSSWDVKNVIQELADNASWSGKIVLILQRLSNTCYAGAYDGSRPAKLTISYSTPGGGGTRRVFLVS